MGGSTAYGTGGLWPHIEPQYPVLDNSETIDAFLERRLAEKIPKLNIEVINAAIASTWTHHHLIYLNQTILKYDPDMVLFLDGYNDFFQSKSGHDQFASYAYNERSRIIMGEPTLYALIYMNTWWIFRKSALAQVTFRGLRTVKRLVTRRPAQPPLDVDERVTGFRQVFRDNALEMIERIGLILRSEGVVPVFMLQPMLVLERDRLHLTTERGRELFEFNIASYRPRYEDYALRVVPIIREMERKTVERVGGEFIDLTTVFKDVEGQVYTDYVHLTPYGNSIVARHVADRIIPLIAEQVEIQKEASPDSGTR
jgi:lysophospholipase L1-like esterase